MIFFDVLDAAGPPRVPLEEEREVAWLNPVRNVSLPIASGPAAASASAQTVAF
jgi:hypothetical protein